MVIYSYRIRVRVRVRVMSEFFTSFIMPVVFVLFQLVFIPLCPTLVLFHASIQSVLMAFHQVIQSTCTGLHQGVITYPPP